jgi:hypothetical protein
MKTSILAKLGSTAVAAILAITLLATAAAPNAYAQDSNYIYCTLRDSSNSVVYYSDVFVGDYSQQLRYSVAFTNYVHGQFSNVIGTASCFFGGSSGEARSNEDGVRSIDRRIYRQLVDTRWSY